MMPTDSPTSSTNDDQAIYRSPLLVGSISADYSNLDLCPWAKTMSGYSMEFDEIVYIQQKCNRWGCRHCGARRIQSLAHRTRAAKPNRLLTLTTWTALFDSPRIAFERCSPQVPQLIRKLRRRHGEIEYLRVVEKHKNGYPHWHLVVRSGYIPFPQVRDTWENLTGNRIVDIRKLKNSDKVYWYVTKYLAKQTYCPFTDRRVSWSGKFFPPAEKPQGVGLKLASRQFENCHPGDLIKRIAPSGTVTKITRDVLVVNPKPETLARLEK